MTLDVLAMQAFTGLSIFTILMLMALGLAIVFGLMGVINMAHGELMAMGAYASYGTAYFFQHYLPGWMDAYIFVGIALAFIVTSLFGYLLERGLIRFLYQRPLDTLLATWGVSLILQQCFRQFINPREVEVPTVSWLQGAWRVTEGISLPLSRIFIICLAIVTAVLVYLLLYRTRSGILIRAVTQNRSMAGAAGSIPRKWTRTHLPWVAALPASRAAPLRCWPRPGRRRASSTSSIRSLSSYSAAWRASLERLPRRLSSDSCSPGSNSE